MKTRIDHALACIRIVHGKGARTLHISIKNRDTHTKTGKFIYKAHGKQLLKHDRLRSHKSVI